MLLKNLTAKDDRAENTSATYANIPANANYFHFIISFWTLQIVQFFSQNKKVTMKTTNRGNLRDLRRKQIPSFHLQISDTQNNLPLGSDRRMAASRWPVCTGWHQGSRHPLQARRTSCPGKVPALRRAASHRTCPACCPAWTRCWSRSLRSWCWRQRPAEGSPPESHAPSCRGKAGEWKERRRVN